MLEVVSSRLFSHITAFGDSSGLLCNQIAEASFGGLVPTMRYVQRHIGLHHSKLAKAQRKVQAYNQNGPKELQLHEQLLF